MKPRIKVITLGVDDLDSSLRFYRDWLGLKTQGIIGTEFEYGAVAFFLCTRSPKKPVPGDAGVNRYGN